MLPSNSNLTHKEVEHDYTSDDWCVHRETWQRKGTARPFEETDVDTSQSGSKLRDHGKRDHGKSAYGLSPTCGRMT